MNFSADWLVFPIIILSSVSIQIATNLWNDAADASSGLDQASERLGPPRATSLGLLKAWHVRLAAFLFLLLAALCGLYLVYVGGWPILLIGIVGIICAFGYSSGPYPISGSPYGEVFVIIFFGIMAVMGSAYLLTGTWSEVSFWAGFYIGLPAAAVLVVNNYRDRVGDEKGWTSHAGDPDRPQGRQASLCHFDAVFLRRAGACEQSSASRHTQHGQPYRYRHRDGLCLGDADQTLLSG